MGGSSEDLIHRNPVQVSKSVEYAARFRADFGATHGLVPFVGLHTSFAGEYQPFAIKSNPWTIFAGRCVDFGSKIDRFGPGATAVVADKQIGIAQARLAAEASNQKITLVRRNLEPRGSKSHRH